MTVVESLKQQNEELRQEIQRLEKCIKCQEFQKNRKDKGVFILCNGKLVPSHKYGRIVK